MACALEGKKHAVTLGKNPRLLIIEKKDKLGCKLRATGNGRCNIANINAPHWKEVEEFFNTWGILTKEEQEGRLYPLSSDANQLADFLTEKLVRENVEILTDTTIEEIEKIEDVFQIKTKDKKIFKCKKILLATGGKSYSSLGTTGDGYVIGKTLNHKVNTLIPALTPIVVKNSIKQLKGLRVDGQVSLLKNGKPIKTEEGNIQFREDSLSGICIMNLSNYVRKDDEFQLNINFIKGEEERVKALLSKHGEDSIYNVLLTVIKKELLKEILTRTGIPPQKYVSALSEAEKTKLIKNMTEFDLKISGLKGWNEAQVTAGGVDLNQICESTMESKLVKGLYFSGEILDYCGICGGYNLSFAWYSAVKAGRSMAESV